MQLAEKGKNSAFGLEGHLVGQIRDVECFGQNVVMLLLKYHCSFQGLSLKVESHIDVRRPK